MKIDIGIYYGPIDLLVYLVRQKEVDIFDIPIARIAEEYLEFINKLERDDFEDVADFLLMAAILIRLKVRSLLPRTPEDEDAGQPVSLIKIVEEYKKYKDIAQAFGLMEAETSKQFPRVGKEEPPLLEGDVMSLIQALRGLKPVKDQSIVLERQEVPIEEIVEEIKNVLKNSGRINFLEFLKAKNNVVIAVAFFFGMLEIIKIGYARVEQDSLFGDIYLYSAEETPVL